MIPGSRRGYIAQRASRQGLRASDGGGNRIGFAAPRGAQQYEREDGADPRERGQAMKEIAEGGDTSSFHQLSIDELTRRFAEQVDMRN